MPSVNQPTPPMKKLILSTLVAFGFPISLQQAQAAITYTETAVINGSLDGVAFNHAAAVFSLTSTAENIAAVGDSTDNYWVYPSYVNSGILSLNIEGFGTATFINDTYGAFSYNAAENGHYLGRIGFGILSDSSAVGISSTVVGHSFWNAGPTYNLSTPFTNTSVGGINSGRSFQTTLGNFALASSPLGYVGDATFTTSIVPEPTTYALFGLGALVMVVACRRKW
jgi:hypothetical protein